MSIPGAYLRPRVARVVGVLLATLIVGAPQTAWAHGGPTSAPQAVTMDIGDVQIRAVLGAVTRVPGIMLIDLSLTTPTRASVPVAIRAWPATSDAGGQFVTAQRPATPAATVQLIAGDIGPYPSQVRIDRAGPWDIELELPGSKSNAVTVARIPVTVTVLPDDPAEPARSLFYSAAGLLAVTGTAVVALTRRQRPAVAAVAGWVTGPVTVAALAVAVTLSVIRLDPAAPAQILNPMAVSLPHVNVTVRALAATPLAGRGSVLELALTDGSTGLPVDDVTPHHEALLHVAVIGPTARDFAHLHPARLAPGRYRLHWTPTDPGAHAIEVELSRGVPGRSGDVGSQVVRQTIQVGGLAALKSTDPLSAAAGEIPDEGAAAVPPPAGLGTRTVAGLDVDVQATGPLVVGEPVGFTATITGHQAAGRRVELRPWLGMAGHVMVRQAAANLFTHLHAVGPMTPIDVLAGVDPNPQDPLEEQLRSNRPGSRSNPSARPPVRQPEGNASSAAGSTAGGISGTGAVIQFSYTFPVAGRYDAWMQFRQGDQVVTVPLRWEVRP